MKASMMCALAKLRRRKVPNLFLGICILLTAALLVNALILLKELDTLFDRAYEEMDGPQMCCLWSSELIQPDAVWRNCLSALVGNSMGLLLEIFELSGLLTPYARLLGITEFSFANSLTETAVSFVLLPICMFLGTSAMVKAISTISVKQLVSE